jgi:hypothetical protein
MLLSYYLAVNSTFEHPAYLSSGNKLCGSIYLLSFGENYSFEL